MKILFLDIDGVVNSMETFERRHKSGERGRGSQIDAELADHVKDIVARTGCKVVPSSSWRGSEDGEREIEQRVCKLFGRTPRMHRPVGTGVEYCERGREIKAWIEAHVDHVSVSAYAIIDDDSDMLPEQQRHFFQTSTAKGITAAIAEKIIEHLNKI